MFKDLLNEKQYEALKDVDNAILILAGAGSGKTRVITYKIAYLVKEFNIRPYNILAVTFTNKAAQEMRTRLYEILDITPEDPKFKSLWITTFHSACARILRKDIHMLGNYTKSFTIYDATDSKKLIKEVVNKLNPQTISTGKNIINTLSNWKNAFITPKEAKDIGFDEDNLYKQEAAQVYENYEEELEKNNALDFDDLIVKTINLFEEFPKVLESYKDFFKYILVDEFQDTNKIQYKLVKMLSGKKNISIVGDDDQSIYSWRGADPENMRNFERDFNAKVIKLEQNYRSTNMILNSANSLIKHNEKRFTKNLWSNKGEGLKLQLFVSETDNDMAKEVVNTIKAKYKPSPGIKTAILYRTNLQARKFEDELIKHRIAYKISGALKFYALMEIKDLSSYLIALINPEDGHSLRRIINVPKRGIGKTTLDRIRQIEESENLNFYNAYTYCVENGIIGSSVKTKIDNFVNWINEKRKSIETQTIVELLEDIIDETGYPNYLSDYDNYEDRLLHIQEFKQSIIEYEESQTNPTLEHYISELSLRTDVDLKDDRTDVVNLMTLHAAKGLEFDNVMIVGLCEELLPYSRSDNIAELEEERRLFYVGLTRAKQNCYLYAFNTGYIYSSDAKSYYPKSYELSRFIEDEIPMKYVERYDFQEAKLNRAYNKQSKISNDVEFKTYSYNSYNRKRIESVEGIEDTDKITNIEEISLGDTLVHKNFGEGRVVKINASGELSTVSISFEGKERLLLLKYTTLYKQIKL